MSYKRVVKKNGKVYGPYVYESYRDSDGNVKKRYLGKKAEREKKSLLGVFLLGVFFVLFFLGVSYTTDYYFNSGKTFGGLTGFVVDDQVDEGGGEVEDSVEEASEDVVVEDEDLDEEVIEEQDNGRIEEQVVSEEGEQSDEGGEQVSGADEQDVGSDSESGVESVVEDVEVLSEEDSGFVGEIDNESGDVGMVENVSEDVSFDNVTNSFADVDNVSEVEDFEENISVNEGVNSSVGEASSGGSGGDFSNESVSNESLIFINETLNDTFVNGTVLNESVSNESILNESVVNETVLNESNSSFVVVSALQYKAVVGRPVKWVRKVNVSEEGLEVEIPKGAMNVSVLVGEEVDEVMKEVEEFEDLVEEADREEISRDVVLSGNVVADLDLGKGILTRFWEWVVGFSVTGRVIDVGSEGDVEVIEKEDFAVVDLSEVVDEDIDMEVAVSYTTAAPESFEVETRRGKRVVVSADSSLNYTDILAYALIDSGVRMDESSLRVYWYEDDDGENGTRMNASERGAVEDLLNGGRDVVPKSVEFEKFDFDGDGFVDYVEWVVPHLSNQVYEIIYISKAEHLDSNRTFLEDVYDYVSKQDFNYTYIGDGEYLRVTFERELDSSKDITIYVNESGNASVEVYVEDGDEVVASFDNLSEGGKYKVYLVNLSGVEDVFDLRVNCQELGIGDSGFGGNGSCGVWVDYVVDPVAGYNFSYVFPTSSDGANVSVGYVEVNVTLTNASDMNEFIWDWNGVNYSIYNSSLVLMYNMENLSVLGENDSIVVDLSGNGNNGSVEGASWSSGGKFGGGYEFLTGELVRVESLNEIESKAYWRDNGTSWDHIMVSSGGTYVNGVLKCGNDMAYIDKLGGYCIDKWEASMPSANSTDMGNSTEVANRNNPGSMAAQSVGGVVPWVQISQVNARVACSNAGKHLCTSEEWLGAANMHGQVFNLPADLSVAPYGCVTDSGTYCLDHSYDDGEACNTGYNSSGPSGCYSAEGVYDMVGNVWEIVNETVNVTNPDGVAGAKYLNENGAWQNSTSGLWSRYGKDSVYFSLDDTDRAVYRGGDWGSWDDAGLFSVYLANWQSTATYDAGFRCCSS